MDANDSSNLNFLNKKSQYFEYLNFIFGFFFLNLKLVFPISPLPDIVVFGFPLPKQWGISQFTRFPQGFSSPNNVGYHNQAPFKARCPCWHSFLSPINVRSPPNPPPFGAQCLYWHTSHVYSLQGTASSL